MPIVCENIPQGDLTRKAEYIGIRDFIWVRETSRPNIPIAKNWSLGPCFLPAKYSRSVEVIENLEVRPDDVWVVTFPKCGTTWTQEMVWQICNDLDFEKAKSLPLRKRFPFLELGTITYDNFNLDMIPIVRNMPSPRFIKSHLPAFLLPKQIWTVKPKIIYVARNVKDVVISYYHHYKNLQVYKGSFEDFLNAFLTDTVVHAPYDSHIIDFWNMRNEENILFLTYEDMKKDHPSVIRKTAEFLDRTLTEDQINILAEHLTFDKMSKNESVNYAKEMKEYHKLSKTTEKDESYNFIRKGQVGSYRNEMTPNTIETFDNWIKDRFAKSQADPQVLDIFMTSK